MMRRVVEVRSGTKQLVSGLLYKLQVAVRTTDLAKGEYSAERLAAANLTGPTKVKCIARSSENFGNPDEVVFHNGI